MEKNKRILITIMSIVVLLIIVILFSIIIIRNKTKNTNKMSNEEKSIYEGLTLIQNKSLIVDYQKNLEKKYIEEYKKNDYTLDKPYVIKNPYEIVNESALIMFKTNNKTSGKVVIKGKDSEKDLIFKFTSDKEHYITIWGLYNNYKNKVTIETDDGKKKEIEIDLTNQENLQETNIEVNKNTKKLDNFYIIDSPIFTSMSLIDSSGNIRGTFLSGISKFIKELDNSHILVSNGNFDEEGKASGMLEMDLSGKVYKYYNLDYRMSYGATVLDNGNILYMTQNTSGLKTFDTIVEINDKGKTIRTIDIYEIMKKIDSNFMETIKDKWGYISGIDYDKKNNEIVISLWYSSTVIGLDYDKETISWIVSNPNDLSQNFSQYLLSPTDVNFEYPKGPYSVNYTDSGISLMVTNWDIKDSLSCSSIVDRKSYVADYNINRNNKTIMETNNYGKDNNYFSYALGDYNKYDNYNLILFGRELENVDYNSLECMLNDYWDLSSKLLLVDNKNDVIYDATIEGPNVIAEKYDINNTISNEFKEGKSYNIEFKGNPVEEKKYDVYSKQIKKKFIYNYVFDFNSNKLIINSVEENLNLLLIDEKNNVYQYKMENDGISSYFSLNTYNKYFKVYIEKDGEIYNTESYLYL